MGCPVCVGWLDHQTVTAFLTDQSNLVKKGPTSVHLCDFTQLDKKKKKKLVGAKNLPFYAGSSMHFNMQEQQWNIELHNTAIQYYNNCLFYLGFY